MTQLSSIGTLDIHLERPLMLPGCGCEWCWCYPLRMRGVEIQISRRVRPIRAPPKRLPNQHSTASATLADHTDLRRRSTLYTTRHSTPIGAAKQPPYVVAQPPLNSLGLSWSKIIRLCSAYQDPVGSRQKFRLCENGKTQVASL